MPILTTQQAKEILGLTGSEEYDEQLSVLLPVVQNHVIFNILKNTFTNPKVYYQNTSISFDADNDKILDSESKFISEGELTSEIDILVKGSLYNDGIYYVKTCEAGALTIDFQHSVRNKFKTEDSDESILIQHMLIEDQSDLKLPTARLVWFLMQKDGLKGVKSESVLTYSVTFLNEIPEELKQMFNKIRKLSW